MFMTLEQLEKEYENKEYDARYFWLQAVLGSEDEAKRAYDENGNFHCIHYFNCQYCPAFNVKHCL